MSSLLTRQPKARGYALNTTRLTSITSRFACSLATTSISYTEYDRSFQSHRSVAATIEEHSPCLGTRVDHNSRGDHQRAQQHSADCHDQYDPDPASRAHSDAGLVLYRALPRTV